MRAWPIAAILACLAAAPLAAPGLTPIEPTARKAGRGIPDYTFAVAADPAVAVEDVRLDVTSLQRDAEPMSVGGVRAAPAGASGVVTGIRLEFDAGVMDRAGAYTVTVRQWRRATDGHGEAGWRDEGVLKFALTAPVGALDLGAPIRVERVFKVPFIPEAHLPAMLKAEAVPGRIVLRETTGATDVSVRGGEGLAQLADAASSAVLGTLRLTLDDGDAAPAGGAVTAALALDLPKRTGALTGTLRLASGQLAGGGATAPVQVTSRLSRAWLVAIILLGVVAGLFVRTKWEGRKTRSRARAAALRALARLDAQAASVPDDGFRRRLTDAADALRRVANDARATEAEAKAAVAAAEAARDAVLKELEETAEALDAKTAAALDALGDADALTHLHLPAAAALLETCRTARARLEEGRLAEAERALSSAAPLRRALQAALKLEADALSMRLADAPRWPEAASDADDKALDRFAADLAAAVPADLPPEHAALGAALRQFDLVLRKHRPRLVEKRAAEVLEIARGVTRQLSRKLKPPEADALARAIDAYEAAAAEAPGNPLFEALFAAERRLWRALGDAVRAADDPAAEQPADPSGGAFAQAARDAIANLGENPLGGAAPGAAVAGAAPAAVDPAAAPSALSFAIEAEPAPAPGARTVFRVRPGWPATAREVSARWFVNGVPRPGETSMACVHVPAPDDAALEVACEVAAMLGAERVRALRTRRFALRPPLRAQAEALDAAADRLEGAQTLVAAVLIGVFGFAIFRESFTGDWESVAAAFAWGFLTDVTLDAAIGLARQKAPQQQS